MYTLKVIVTNQETGRVALEEWTHLTLDDTYYVLKEVASEVVDEHLEEEDE